MPCPQAAAPACPSPAESCLHHPTRSARSVHSRSQPRHAVTGRVLGTCLHPCVVQRMQLSLKHCNGYFAVQVSTPTARLACPAMGRTDSSASNKHDRLLQANHEVKEESERGCLSSGHKQARHGHARVIVNVCDQICPGRELVCLEVDKVVVDCALARDLDRGPCALPPLVKVLPAEVHRHSQDYTTSMLDRQHSSMWSCNRIQHICAVEVHDALASPAMQVSKPMVISCCTCMDDASSLSKLRLMMCCAYL